MEDEPHRVFRHSRHYELSFGYSRSSNKSCGTSIMLHSKVFPQRCIRRIFCPPVELEGRCGAVRLKSGSLDVLFVTMYFPVYSSMRAGRDEQKRKVNKMLAWLRNLLLSTGGRCTPIVGMDLNDGLGRAREFIFEGEAIPVEEEVGVNACIGEFDADLEGVAG
eukprot:9493867-Pyramimonas_sp.AAC.1